MSPSLGYYFNRWKEGNILSVEKSWLIMSFAYKWQGKAVKVVALGDFKDLEDDTPLLKKLWELFNKADVIICHNGDKFDIKKCNARFVSKGFKPPSPYKTIDTLKIARRYFGFESNSLDELSRHFKIGQKKKHSGVDLWISCVRGNKKAWSTMKLYNKQDVVLLEKIYLKLRGWDSHHPSISLRSCPTCNSSKIFQRGYEYLKKSKKRKLSCQSCGRWFYGESERYG